MKTGDIIEWREAIISLPQEHFFDLICSYLGEIKTPFNKQKLTEQLSAFLRKPRIKEIIIAGLDSFDILVLTAIHSISKPSENIIADFFCGMFSLSEVYEKLTNLEERLLIYRTKVLEKNNGKIYKINPMLLDELLPHLNAGIFLMPEKKENISSMEFFGDVFFAGLYSFIFHNPDIMKKDGILKKKSLTLLSEIFPYLREDVKRLYHILNAFRNMGLIVQTEEGFKLQDEKWKNFGCLNLAEKASYICTAAYGKFGKEKMQKAAQIFCSLIFSLKDGYWYQEDSIKQNYFLLYKNSFKFADTESDHYFWAENEDFLNEYVSVNALRAAEVLGVFFKNGNLISLNPEVKRSIKFSESPFLISPSFEVSLKPDARLSEILTVLKCMKPVSIQTLGTFCITRKSCGTLFGTEVNSENLCAALKKFTRHEIPQNVIVSINQWYKNYISVSLYKGIVICVTEEKEKFFSGATPVSALVHKKLADGVYLMKNRGIKELEEAVQKTGLEFIFHACNSCIPQIKSNSFCSLEIHENEDFIKKAEWEKEQKKRAEKYCEHIKKLQDKIQKINLKKDEYKILSGRILRRVIINEEQIRAESIRHEDKEASGAHFFGKLRIAEKAISEKHFLEISFYDGKSVKKILGLPISLEKENNDAKLILQTGSENKTVKVLIGQALKIKVVKNSIFS